jgi:hypothetical protein
LTKGDFVVIVKESPVDIGFGADKAAIGTIKKA